MNKLRKWINRDDGKYYRVGNENLSFLQILGGILMICGFLLMACQQKASIEIPQWVILVTFALAAFLWWSGDCSKQRKRPNHEDTPDQ